MQKLNICGAALAILIAPSLLNAAAAVPANRVAKVTYEKKPLSAAKNPITKNFLLEQARAKRGGPNGLAPTGPTMGTLSINCGLVPDAEECAGTVESAHWEYPYFDNFTSSMSTANVELERVTVDGKSSCAGTVTTNYGSFYSVCGVIISTDVTFNGMAEIDWGVIRDTAKDFAEFLKPEPPKKLVKCIFDQEIAAAHPGWTLVRDRRDDYAYAELTFMKLYGAALPGIDGALFKSSTVDVKYPNGDVFTFMVYKNFDSTAVELVDPKLNEKVASGENSCA